jgi:hypothetical protein
MLIDAGFAEISFSDGVLAAKGIQNGATKAIFFGSLRERYPIENLRSFLLA